MENNQQAWFLSDKEPASNEENAQALSNFDGIDRDRLNAIFAESLPYLMEMFENYEKKNSQQHGK